MNDTTPRAAEQAVENLMESASRLSCDDQHALASRIAANVGYDLAAQSEIDHDPGQPVRIGYTNWRGEATAPTIMPTRVFWGSNEWHPEPCWLLEALDVDKQAVRTFDLRRVRPASGPDRSAALARALPSAVGRHRVEAAKRVVEIVRDYVPFEDTHRYPAMTDLRTRLPDIEAVASALTSGAQAGAAGDRPGAAPRVKASWRPMSEEPYDRPITVRKRLDDGSWWYARVRAWCQESGPDDRGGDHAYHLMHHNGTMTTSLFHGPFDGWCEIGAEVSASGAAPAGGLPGVEALRTEATFVEGWFTDEHERRSRLAAGTGDAGRDVEIKTVALIHDPSRLYTLPDLDDAVAAMEPGVPWHIPARVADDLAYCSEVDAALADRHGSSVIGAAARPTAADGLREAARAVMTARQALTYPETTSLALFESIVALQNALVEEEAERAALDAAPLADRGEAGGIAYAVTDFDRLEGGMFYDEADALTCADRIAKQHPGNTIHVLRTVAWRRTDRFTPRQEQTP